MAIATEAVSISEAAKSTGVSAHTLRYYERAGLMLGAVNRASSTHRRYTERDLRWIVMLTKLRSTGMPIRTVARYAELVRSGEGTEAERLALLEAHRTTVLAQLDDTRQNLEAIERKITLYREQTGS